MTTVRLSEQRVQRLEAWAGEAMGEFVSISDIAIQFAELRELIRGYRRAAALEDMLREWVADMKHGWAGKNGGKMHETCGYCYKDIPDHYPECLVARTEALLAEGDE